MVRRDGRDQSGLLLLATLVSIQIAQGRTPDELELLSAFFEVLGDDLALLALRSGREGRNPIP